jgi:phosphoenolpyruvate-protein kinase (PTS system EI component)
MLAALAGRAALALLIVAPGLGCRSAYYSAMETLGQEKRDILVDRVEDARDDQEAAKKQFQSALARFKEVTGFEGGDLEDQHDRLDADYQRCEARAEAVRQRIRSVDQVAADLFDEWQAEIASMQNASLRRRSEEMRRRTEQRHQALMKSMKRAESRMEPVLAALRDQALFLKHNLNARALASLEAQVPEIESDVSVLVRDMEASIREADAYLAALAEAG